MFVLDSLVKWVFLVAGGLSLAAVALLASPIFAHKPMLFALLPFILLAVLLLCVHPRLALMAILVSRPLL